MTKSARLSALAGIVGPAMFIAAWVSAGALTTGYSWIDDAISRLAASGAPRRVLMTAGFVGLGVALPTYALVLRRYLRGSAWMATATSGAATLGVALLPLGTTPALDGAHNAMAGFAYVALVATPLLAARPLVAADHRRAAMGSLVTGGLAGGCLVATLLGPAHGLFQRAGLTIVDMWLMASALVILTSTSSGPGPAAQAHRSARS